jgi:site-specific DNA-methyltransferase (adenine-specific)
VTIYPGDCRDVLKMLPEASVDSVVCDPPYGLEFMGKEWDSFTGAGMSKPGIGERETHWPSFTGTNKTRCRSCGQLVGQGGSACQCDNPQPYNAALPRLHAFEAWCFTWAVEVFRVLKPGGHLVAFGGTRTYHRMVCAIEDAGFEIRDQIGWAYGQGFPKSHDVSKAIDQAAGMERERVRPVAIPRGQRDGTYALGGGWQDEPWETAAATEAAKQWEGWGTALKPAWEPIVLARKPLVGTVAENVLRFGTGALNIDGCKVPGSKPNTTRGAGGQHGCFHPLNAQGRITDDGLGRWPANLCHDGSQDVLAAFPDSKVSGAARNGRPVQRNGGAWGRLGHQDNRAPNDAGSAARFFYCAKAGARDRLGSRHPTVKPVSLMQWLVRLVTPPDGVVLDPFAGSGTTGEAAWREGMRAILIEREPEYIVDAALRMHLADKPDVRAAFLAQGKADRIKADSRQAELPFEGD